MRIPAGLRNPRHPPENHSRPPDGRRVREPSPASGFPASGARATVPASRVTGPMPRAPPRASGTTRPRTRRCMASRTGCRPSSGGTSISSPPRSATAAATTTNTPWPLMSRATARPGNRRLKTRRRSCPRRCVIWPAGSTGSLRRIRPPDLGRGHRGGDHCQRVHLHRSRAAVRVRRTLRRTFPPHA